MRPLLIALAAACAGCTTWQPLDATRPAAVAFDSFKVYRVTLASGAVLVASCPGVARDSLVWMEPCLAAANAQRARHAEPLDAIRRVEVQNDDGTSAIALVAVLLLGIGFLSGVQFPGHM